MEKLPVPKYIDSIRSSRYSIEKAVSEVLENCHVRLVPPINVWDIAKELQFEVYNATFKDECISGIMVDSKTKVKPMDSKRAIVLNRNESREVQAFTIAHEIAHFVLHCNDKKDFYEAYHVSRKKSEDSLTDEEWQKKKIEDEADTFAANLLMPTAMFMKYVICSKNRDSKNELTEELSKLFMVEKEAISRRYQELSITFE